MPAHRAYTAYMEAMQYTVRGIPASVDERLRATARRSHRSLNAVVVEILDRATRPHSREAEGNEDLDWFIGSAPRDVEEQQEDAEHWLDSLPNDLP